MNDKKLPNDYWAEVMVVDVHILNISPTMVVRNITPYKAWFHRKPNVIHLMVFGRIAYALIYEND